MQAVEHAVCQLLHDLRPEIDALPPVAAADDSEWRRVQDLGTRLWLDTGDADEAARLWNGRFEALTTNNSLLNHEVQKGLYDNLVQRAAEAITGAAPGIDPDLLVLETAFVLNAYHGLKLVHCFGAHVSVELHTDLSGDIERTVAYGKRFHALCPERFYVKVPMTPAGLLGARELGQAGIPVNFTLGFSARQNVAAALIANPSFVNVFMGRINAFVADNELGDGANMGEKATLATQRELLSLRGHGRTHSRLIGASMRSGDQVASLAGLDVYTMPPKVAAQYRQNPAPALVSRVETNPEVTTAPGFSLEDFNAGTLWEVLPDFRDAVDKLLENDPDDMSADELQAHFAREGQADFMPAWTAEQLAAVTTDGKIPVYNTWQEPLKSGAIGMDALLNISALQSFAIDQKALDDRIRANL